MVASRRVRILKAILVVVALGIVAGFAAASRWTLPVLFDDEAMVDGVSAAGIELGGLSRGGARRVLERYRDDCLNTPIQLRLGDEAWIVQPADLGTHFDVEAAVSGAYGVGRTGSFFARKAQRRAAAHNGVEIPLVVSVDQQQLTDIVYAMSAEVQLEPIDAQLSITEDDQVLITPSVDGRGLIARELPELLRRATMSSGGRIIDLPIEILRPAVTTAELEARGIGRLLSKYTTKFNASNYKRTANVRLGARKIDGVVLAPGDTFSFNDVVGPRTADRGFLEADVIVNSELVPGLGGGICQVSTTLYNAALLGGLEVASRMNHSLPVSYVPLGRDATVSYGAIDLRFRNNTQRHVLIKASTDRDTITVKVFGNAPEGIAVNIQTEVTEKIAPSQIQRVDPAAAPGSSIVTEEGAPGYRVSVYRVFVMDGAEQKRELISNDRYKPKPSVITVGPPALAVSASDRSERTARSTARAAELAAPAP